MRTYLNDLIKLLSFSLIFSMLLILPIISNVDAFLQTGTPVNTNLNHGESLTFQWGLMVQEGENTTIELSAKGEGSELLSFPKTIEAETGVWNIIDITITIPEDYPTDVLITPALYAVIEGEKGEGVLNVNVQMKNTLTIIIGNPILEESKAEEKPVETQEEIPEEKTTQEPASPFSLESPEEGAV